MNEQKKKNNANLRQNRHITQSCYNKFLNIYEREQTQKHNQIENTHKKSTKQESALSLFIHTASAVISPSNRRHIHRQQIE